jgi:hypothetical protein
MHRVKNKYKSFRFIKLFRFFFGRFEMAEDVVKQHAKHNRHG